MTARDYAVLRPGDTVVVARRPIIGGARCPAHPGRYLQVGDTVQVQKLLDGRVQYECQDVSYVVDCGSLERVSKVSDVEVLDHPDSYFARHPTEDRFTEPGDTIKVTVETDCARWVADDATYTLPPEAFREVAT